MMKGKMMEEKIRIPENGSPIPVLHQNCPIIILPNIFNSKMRML